MPHLQKRRVAGLDMLRGIASLSVCMFHLTAFPFPTSNGLFYDALRQTFSFGWLGVEVFFCISGFVIPYSLNNSGYRIQDYPTFVLKRVVRLDPPYLVSIVLIILVAYIWTRHTHTPFLVEGEAVTWKRVALHLGYLNTFAGMKWLSPVFWSLAYEFQFYILIGLLFPLFVSRRRNLRVVTTLLIVGLCMMYRDDRFIVNIAPIFLMGILTFQYLTGLTGKKEYLALLMVSTAATCLTLGIPHTLAGLFAVVVILKHKRVGRAASFLGEISYSLYLLHWTVGPIALSIAASKLFDTSNDLRKTLALLLSLTACLVASYLLNISVERPAQFFSSRIKYKGARTRPAVVPAPAKTDVEVGLEQAETSGPASHREMLGELLVETESGADSSGGNVAR